MGAAESKSKVVISNSKMSEFIESEVAKHSVVVWSKSYCPYCTQTKQVFQSQFPTADVVVHELDKMQSGTDVQAALLKMTGQRTVPNVFVKGKHVGGNDDTQAAARSGKLNEWLSAL